MSVTRHNTDDIDIVSARWDYENTRCSFKQLSKKYGGYPMFYSRVSKEEGWEKFDPDTADVRIAVAKFNERESRVRRPDAILDTIGVRKVNEIVRELGSNYSPVDEPLVLAYAETYQRYLKIAQQVNEDGEVLISPKTGGEYLNPKFNAMQSLKGDLVKIGNQLGLSIASRKRLALNFGAGDDAKTLFDFVEQISGGDDVDV